jgi:uncharacterized membrane protein YcaP (DUF421 family)
MAVKVSADGNISSKKCQGKNMSIHNFWEALILLIAGIVLIRIAGKKSIAQMTGVEIVVVLAIGTTMGHAIKENKFWQVIILLSLFVLFLIVIQYVQLKIKFIERILVGSATIVVSDGEIVMESLKKLRMTKEQLEMRLREKGISHICSIKTATIESNGKLGYELKDEAKPITRKELMQALGETNRAQKPQEDESSNLFTKIPR